MKYLAVFLFLGHISCNFSNKNKVDNYILDDQRIKLTDRIKGKFINSIDSVIGKRQEDKCVLLLINFHDCDNCVNAGFYISKKIDSLNHSPIVKVVCSMMNPSNFQNRNEYYEYVYYDENDLIRRELKYLPTPCFVLLNGKNQVLDFYFPTDTFLVNYNNFVQSCLK